MSKYDVYGLGNALVDMEFEISEQFLQDNAIDKGIMTLVDENQQHELIEQLDTRKHQTIAVRIWNLIEPIDELFPIDLLEWIR